MKISNKFVIYLFALLIFVIYLFSANYIFNILIIPEKEARLAGIGLPLQTNDIKFAIDKTEVTKLKWKDALFIKGWVFKENVSKEKRDIYLVLKSRHSILVFKIEKDDINRPDVSAGFHLEGGIHNHGFEAFIPLYRLKEDSYQIGFVVVDETGKHYSLFNKALWLSNDSAFTGDCEPEQGSISHRVALSLKGSAKKVSYCFDIVIRSGKYLTVRGWGFLNGMNTGSMRSYILLKKNKNVMVFDAELEIRKDITTAFGKYKLNLDSSGFLSCIPVGDLEKGKHQLGLYILKGDQAGTVWSDKYIDIGR
jgi:hypothetical protein